MPLLPSVSFDLSHRHALDAERGKRLPDFVELEGFDDGRDKLHLPSFRVIASAGRAPGFNELSRSGPTFGLWLNWLIEKEKVRFLAVSDSKTGKLISPKYTAEAVCCLFIGQTLEAACEAG
jgi:hypothetical protein